MTARTLEEIEALAADATPGPWYAMDVHGWYDIRSEGVMIVGDQGVDSEKNAELIAALPDLLAIAQEQRGAMTADEERTRAAAMRVWGEHVRGCDTADAMADLIVRQREEIARLKARLCEPGKCPVL